MTASPRSWTTATPTSSLIIPSSGTSFEVGATAIFKGAAHSNAAKLWIEYALSPECVELAAKNGSYQFLVIDNAEQPCSGFRVRSGSQQRHGV